MPQGLGQANAKALRTCANLLRIRANAGDGTIVGTTAVPERCVLVLTA